MATHGSSVYHNLESLLADVIDPASDDNKKRRWKRYWTRTWKAWKQRHPNDPLVLRCSICSGDVRQHEIKAGTWKVSTREEQKQIKEEIEQE